MSMLHRTALLWVAGLVGLSACASHKLEPPVGFVVVSEHGWETRMKAQDNVGLSLRRFNNVKGGTLAYWGSDLVKKLGDRGYVLQAQSAVKTKNGQAGTRFDFAYNSFDTEIPKFYTAVLVVTDAYKVVLQVAGNAPLAASYRARIPDMMGELTVRGCKVGSKICGGPQPPPLSTPAPGTKPPADDTALVPTVTPAPAP